MNMKRWSASTAAAIMVGGLTIAAQTPASSTKDQKDMASPAITITGCVQNESAVLKRNPIAAGVGMGDEFVLTNAAVTPAPGSNEAPKPDVQAPPAPTGTSGSSAGFGQVYRVTGDKENDLKPYLGQRVSIVGRVKVKEGATDKMSSIGTTGKAAEGARTPDNTPELIIDSIAQASGTCAPAVK
jgi:hypothetical protein